MVRSSMALGWLALCSVLALGSASCGDDDGGGGDGGLDGGGGTGRAGAGGSGGSGGTGGSSGSGGDDGGMGTGMGIEGDLCQRATDCGGTLICVDSGFNVGVCARGCVSDDDCGTELCLSRTNFESDLHCENVERAEFALCGAAVTAICAENYTCLISPDVPVLGVCTNICLVDEDNDGGTPAVHDGDAGFATCDADQTCVNIEFQSEPDGNVGICAQEVEIGEACGIEMGTLCKDTDVCAPADPLADDTEYFCRVDCSEDGECSEGTCTDVRNEYAYCAP